MEDCLNGGILHTGTGIAAPPDFSPRNGDEVAIRIDGIGVIETLIKRHQVRGRANRA